MNEHTTVTAVVHHSTEQGVILTMADQTIQWPAEAAPAGLQPGDTVQLRLLNEEMAQADRQEQARAIVSHILGETT